jgi:hypothetical protein
MKYYSSAEMPYSGAQSSKEQTQFPNHQSFTALQKRIS